MKTVACVLLFFHGGGFVAGDATVPADVVAAAPVKCLVVGVPYTLGNLGAAWRDSRDAAKRVRHKHRLVLAYGESAGAAIATRLAQEGLADATAAFVPPADLWAGIKDPAVQQMIDSTGASDWERWQLSPAMHSSRRPVLAQIMRQDMLLNTDAQWSWVDRDPRVEGQQVEGTHVWPVRPADRATQLRSAMDFLKRKTKRLRRSAAPGVTARHTAEHVLLRHRPPSIQRTAARPGRRCPCRRCC